MRSKLCAAKRARKRRRKDLILQLETLGFLIILSMFAAAVILLLAAFR